MIEKALKYIVGLKNPDIREIGGQTYSDKTLYRVNHNPKAEPIEFSTLSSLCDYIRTHYDERGKVFVHVVSPLKVQVYSVLDEDRTREHLVNVVGQVPSFDFGTFMDHEKFCINLQSKFINTPERALLLKFAGTVEAGTIAEYGDDGVTQKATVKTGITSKQEALVPSPIALTAYRTFIEVEQPIIEYIFRMKQGMNGGVQCALFEADGGAWRIDAMEKIKDYLKVELALEDDIVILY